MPSPYDAWTLVHVAGVVLWAGSAVGGFLMLLGAPPASTGEGQRLRRRFLRAVACEHLGLLLLLAGLAGLTLISGTPALPFLFRGPGWMRAKAFLLVAFVLPVEIRDVWLAHVVLPARFRAFDRDPSAERLLVEALGRYDRFVARTAPVFAILIPLLLALAVLKPGGG